MIAVVAAQLLGQVDKVPSHGNPVFDWHALAPELVLVGTLALVLALDFTLPERTVWQTSRVAAFGVLAALVPIATLAHQGQNRSLFGGTYVVDNYALALKAF